MNHLNGTLWNIKLVLKTGTLMVKTMLYVAEVMKAIREEERYYCRTTVVCHVEYPCA